MVKIRNLPLYVCLWTQRRRSHGQSSPACWTQTSRQTSWFARKLLLLLMLLLFKLVRDEGFPTEADAVRPPCRRRPPCYWQKVKSSQLVGIVAENINTDKHMSKFFSNKTSKKQQQKTGANYIYGAGGLFCGTAAIFLPSNRSQTLFALSPGSGIVVFREPTCDRFTHPSGRMRRKTSNCDHGAFRSTA